MLLNLSLYPMFDANSTVFYGKLQSLVNLGSGGEMS